MPAPSVNPEMAQTTLQSVAKAMSKTRMDDGSGMGKGVCVRLTPTVQNLLEHAKSETQSMPQFLREAAITVALQRLEDSQN